MRPRFHLPDLDPQTGGVLTGDEATHLTRVLRLGIGAEVEVFDGRGHMFAARVTQVSRDAVALALIAPVAPAPEARVRVTLAASVLKGDKMDQVVRDAAMMGVAAIQPLVATRSEISLAALVRAGRTARWRRIAVSAAKQCGRAVVPAVHEAAALDGWLRQAPSGPLLALIEPVAGEGGALGDLPPAVEATLLVGPEGGWTAEEVAAIIGVGGTPVRLGGRTLRAEAAPLVALAALFEAWRGW